MEKSLPILLVVLLVGLQQAVCDTGAACKDDCSGLANGDYQSCDTCSAYHTCSNYALYPNRPCPTGLVWDDTRKKCKYTSSTYRCEDGPIMTDVASGGISVTVLSETGCSNLDMVPAMPLCSGECGWDRCPESQCLPTRLDYQQRFRQFVFQCDSGLKGIATTPNYSGCTCVPDEFDDSGDILPHCDLVKDQHDANTDSFMIDGETCTNINPYSVRFCTGRCSPNNICIASATEFKRIKIKCGEASPVTYYIESATTCDCV